jgi:hypothetical protein
VSERPEPAQEKAGYEMPGPQWCARRDGEIVLIVSGPDAEHLARAAAAPDGTVAYREPCRPTRENGWQLDGPWVDVE